ncbi:MAG: hypothetical protein JW910_04875 [Anaerolineae bacterium]|nr:hypothetical protein [Anaerolineae bacterium]
MKMDFELTEEHQLILRILYAAGNRTMTYEAFSHIYAFASVGELGLDDLAAAFAIQPTGVTTPSFAIDIEAVEHALESLESVGLVEIKGLRLQATLDANKLELHRLRLTDEGKRVAKAIVEARRITLYRREPHRTTVFVASAFGHAEIDALYQDVFREAAEALGYEAVRVDMSEPSQTITAHMMDAITAAECILADLTHARPSVYFEVGYAHGLGIPLLLTCRADHQHSTDDAARVHFDLQQYKISYWTRDAASAFVWPDGMNPAERLAELVKRRD